MSTIFLDKRFETFSPYKSKCIACLHFDVTSLVCLAFPNGIPKKYLSGDSIHNKIDKDQIGNNIFTPIS